MPDINYWLNRKYAILQQQADATTQNAATAALTGTAAARLDTTRANLMPAESAANIAQTRANTNLTNQQASVVRPVAFAQVNNLNASALASRVGAASDYDFGVARTLPDGSIYRPPLSSVFGGTRPFRFGDILGN